MQFFKSLLVFSILIVLSKQQNIGSLTDKNSTINNNKIVKIEGIFNGQNNSISKTKNKDGLNASNSSNINTNVVFKKKEGSIIRPCPTYQINCIRKYFVENGNCRPNTGKVPDPLYRAQANFFYSSFNLSVTQTGLSLRGINNAKIEELYLNKETDVVLLVVQFLNVQANSTVDFYRYHRVGKEPAITKSQSAAFLPSFTTTTIFRGVDYLDLAKSETTGFVDAAPIVNLDPSAGVHPDPIVAKTFASFLANESIVLQEALFIDSVYYASTYIQYVICDFGLKLL